MDNKEKARILSTITNEQWQAIASLDQGEWEAILDQSEGRSLASENYDTDKDIERKVNNIMKELGITGNINGYDYLIEAVIRVYKDPSYMKAITKRLYPDIAKKFDSTSSNVERNIRFAVTKAFKNSNNGAINKYFSKGKYTNSTAIADLVNFVRIYQ